MIKHNTAPPKGSHWGIRQKKLDTQAEAGRRRRSTGLGSWQGGLRELWRDCKSLRATVLEYLTQASEMSQIQFLVWSLLHVIFQQRAQYVTVVFLQLHKMWSRKHTTIQVFFPWVCNFNLGLVTNRSTSDFQHPLIAPLWYFHLKSSSFQQQMMVCSI